MKLKIFHVQSTNKKPQFDQLETSVNEWLADHPNVVIDSTNFLTQPNMNWFHLSMTVWYTED